MVKWKAENKIFLPESYEEWKDRITYIKDVIRQIFIEYELIFDVEEDIVLNDVKLDFYLEKYKLGVKINDLISRNSTKPMNLEFVLLMHMNMKFLMKRSGIFLEI